MHDFLLLFRVIFFAVAVNAKIVVCARQNTFKPAAHQKYCKGPRHWGCPRFGELNFLHKYF